MCYLKLIPVILYLVEAFAKAQSFVPPLDGSDYSYIDYTDYYENGGFGESNLDGPSGSDSGGGRWPQEQDSLNGRPQEQRGFGSRPLRPGLQQGQGGFGGSSQQGLGRFRGSSQQGQGGFGGRPQQGQGRFRGRPQQGQGGFGRRPQQGPGRFRD